MPALAASPLLVDKTKIVSTFLFGGFAGGLEFPGLNTGFWMSSMS